MKEKKQVSDYYVQKITLYFMENDTAKSRNFLSTHLKIPRPQVSFVIEQGLQDGMIIADKGGILRRTKKFEKNTGIDNPALKKATLKFAKKAIPRLKGKGHIENTDVFGVWGEDIMETAQEYLTKGYDKDTFPFFLRAVLAGARAKIEWDEIEEEVQQAIRDLKQKEASKKKYKRVKKPV